jgi:hypothetical protein
MGGVAYRIAGSAHNRVPSEHDNSGQTRIATEAVARRLWELAPLDYRRPEAANGTLLLHDDQFRRIGGNHDAALRAHR